MKHQSARPPRKVLHVFGCMNRAGSELRTLDIMRRLNRDEFTNQFVSLSGEAGDLDGEIRSLGGEVHLCRVKKIGFAREFQRLLRREQIDVVHSHVQLASGWILRCAAKAGVNIRIAHFRSMRAVMDSHWRRRLQYSLMRKWITQYAATILGNSESSLALSWRRDWADDPRCAIIHNGLDVSDFAALNASRVRAEFGWPADCPLAIHVGRMSAPKNHARLIEIIAAVAQREPNVRFLLAGRFDDEIRAHLKSRISALRLHQHIAMVGNRSDVPRLLHAANVMIFPSLWEGLPGAVLEACAAGTPVVASDIPPCVEIASHLPNVYPLPLSDSNRKWAGAVLQAIRSPTANERQAARKLVEGSVYGIDRCVKAHELAWSGNSGLQIRALYETTQPPAWRAA